jgi:uncharacterized membrane protein
VNTDGNTEVPPLAEGGLKLVARNVKALMDERRKEENQASVEQRVADRITAFAGSMSFVYLHAIVFGLWTVINVGWLPLPKFDQTFVILGTSASVEAIFLSTFILISQNRMNAVQEQRADLDLQVSLLAEHEVSKLIYLTSRIANSLGLEEGGAAELRELEGDVHPEKVLEKIQAENKSDGANTN